MDITVAVRYDGVTCILVSSPARCCTSNWKDRCGVSGGEWCEKGFCSNTQGASFETLFGHPVKWERVKGDSRDARVVVLVDGALYELILTEHGVCQPCSSLCDLFGSITCSKYCATKSHTALCKQLNAFLGTEGSYFKRVKG